MPSKMMDDLELVDSAFVVTALSPLKQRSAA
jgi:hypothetical protein